MKPLFHKMLCLRGFVLSVSTVLKKQIWYTKLYIKGINCILIFILQIFGIYNKYPLLLLMIKKIKSKVKSALKGVKQRLYYIKHSKKGFNFIFLVPGSIRESLGDNTFFRTLTKNNKNISLKKSGEYTLLNAGKFKLKFPKGCFYEGDFFDIIYPSLHLQDPLIEALVYKNPYYESEGCYESFGVVLHQGDYVIDAGANIGMFSIIASNSVGQNGKVFAFEPLKEISNILEENSKENNFQI